MKSSSTIITSNSKPLKQAYGIATASREAFPYEADEVGGGGGGGSR